MISIPYLGATANNFWISSFVGGRASVEPSSSGTPTTYTNFVDLAKEVEPPNDGILTRTLFNDDHIKAVIFGFGQGEELSEHTASMPAILHFIQGEATLTLGDETVEAQPGTWVHMPANLKHSVKTKTPVVMLLLLLKK
ncbi:cupin domain-containing protein [Lignipirellula cremea]|uniref:Cupin domain protein n=1 Tax=Lignipirellula cremea TaxID=2528010 RepID=A0A518DQH8_9BACT|nr:cupin domain-containing protein [Lignipirellula cremea]QDU94095.1 Cupin domain protein [Lignipirellula cremea]